VDTGSPRSPGREAPPGLSAVPGGGPRGVRRPDGVRGGSPVLDLYDFLGRYVVLPGSVRLVVSAWVIAAWLCEAWDKFPHLAITSPGMRCGKSTLLTLLGLVVPRPRETTNISPAALYRLVAKERPTLLMDEAQSLARRGSETSEVVREILNAGIGRNAKVTRCGGERYEDIQEFPVYGPKVFALIGELDGVLADRCLPVEMARKTRGDTVERFLSRDVDPKGKALHDRLARWAEANADRVRGVYDALEPFDIRSDRMAELLLPLQAVLTVAEPGALLTLKTYARRLDERDKEQETQPPGVRLLAACREIFAGAGKPFLPTRDLLEDLYDREEEPWAEWNQGRGLNAEGLFRLLRPYGIRSHRDAKQTCRGYSRADFEPVWARYLPPVGPTPVLGGPPVSPSTDRVDGLDGSDGLPRHTQGDTDRADGSDGVDGFLEHAQGGKDAPAPGGAAHYIDKYDDDDNQSIREGGSGGAVSPRVCPENPSIPSDPSEPSDLPPRLRDKLIALFDTIDHDAVFRAKREAERREQEAERRERAARRRAGKGGHS
jgi:hypothetical protein